MAARSTKVCGPFDDADLASHMLRRVPWNWQDQYELSGALALVPQSVRELLEVLECIKKAYPIEKMGKDLRMQPSLTTHLRRRWLLLVTGFKEMPHREVLFSLQET